jgi:hypothetical protein
MTRPCIAKIGRFSSVGADASAYHCLTLLALPNGNMATAEGNAKEPLS